MTLILIARFTFLVPHDGMEERFEAGYRRHLEWHRKLGDPWIWYGWTIVSGERYGAFLDATIDRTPEELETPVAPAEDAGHMRENVLSSSRVHSTGLYRRRLDVCKGEKAAVTAPFASLLTVRVRPGRRAEFEEALRDEESSRLCFELVSGGAVASYLILVPHRRLSDAFRGALVPATDAVEEATIELLRFRPELTYVPDDVANDAIERRECSDHLPK